jgi:hypothetical protein
MQSCPRVRLQSIEDYAEPPDGDSARPVCGWEWTTLHYIGHPYYVSENPILHALGQHLDSETASASALASVNCG